MGEIRFVGTGETRGYPYLVCKKRFVGTGETRGYPDLVCKKRIVGPGKTRGYPYPVCKNTLSISVHFFISSICFFFRVFSFIVLFKIVFAMSRGV